MTEKHLPRYLSPSRLWAYDRCPQVYVDRYIRKLEQPASFERDFGSAVHAGLEAHFRSLDHEMAFLLSWRTATKALKLAGVTVPGWLTSRGLELVEMVRHLGISGEPEQRIGITAPGISVPIIGYVDLWIDADPEHGEIVDFKTTSWGWTQEHADREVFQPAVYSQAYSDQHSYIPKFTYIVLPRNGSGGLTQLDGTRTGDQIAAAFERITEIHKAIEAQQFECACKGKYCTPQEEAA